MPTGPEMYEALRQATRELGVGSEFTVNSIEAYDLRKLRPSDLIAVGYDDKIAEEVSSALLNGDYTPLARSMGIQLTVSHEADRLLSEDD
jgi:hypothetical protein